MRVVDVDHNWRVRHQSPRSQRLDLRVSLTPLPVVRPVWPLITFSGNRIEVHTGWNVVNELYRRMAGRTSWAQEHHCYIDMRNKSRRFDRFVHGSSFCSASSKSEPDNRKMLSNRYPSPVIIRYTKSSTVLAVRNWSYRRCA